MFGHLILLRSQKIKSEKEKKLFQVRNIVNLLGSNLGCLLIFSPKCICHIEKTETKRKWLVYRELTIFKNIQIENFYIFIKIIYYFHAIQFYFFLKKIVIFLK